MPAVASERSRHGEARFGPDPDSAKRARLALEEVLASAAVDPEATANALLVLSEIITNVIRHARTDFTVRAEVKDRTLRVEVLDYDPRPPMLQSVDAASTSGRGLHMVAVIASSWGWSAAEGEAESGKVVWAELSLEPTESARR